MRNRFWISTLALAISCTAVSGASAQTVPQPHPVIVAVPAANPADVASIDAIISALYEVISGPAGQARDWNRMRSLFVPGGRLMPAGPRPTGEIGLRIFEVNDYIALSGAYLERVGFRENEIARKTERFGHIAHVFSTYHGTMETESTEIRGINSIQLMFDGTRWWIISVYWEAEREDNPLPAQYLPPATR
jgi:hypothetical protein